MLTDQEKINKIIEIKEYLSMGMSLKNASKKAGVGSSWLSKTVGKRYKLNFHNINIVEMLK